MSVIVLFVVLFLLSFCLTYLYKNWAIKQSILDVPNERSSHVIPTPRGGGIAIVLVFYTCLFYVYLNGQVSRQLFLALLPGIALAILGSLDDVKPLSPLIRILAHFVCSGIALYFLGGFQGFYGININLLWSLIALLGFVWFINIFNFIDGSDGYASMEAISVVVILWYFTRINIFLFLGIIVCGFLYWNWPKAKIFMGDAGSTTLGYILVVFGIYLHNSNQLNFIFWLTITSLFWFDATITLIKRILNREALSVAHRKHIYQRAILGGFSHLQVLLSGLVINILLFVICLTITIYKLDMGIGLISALVILWIAMKYVDRKFPFENKRNNL
jgi:UDP-N-acetylmuramyl pentapeptide phosphotransferase/UDP-N-acetylglucosamine-1-phosphate transferase